MTIKTTNDRAAMVDTAVHWISVREAPPPTGPKLLLINRKLGVAVLGQYTKAAGWTHYAPLPTFKD